MFGSSARPWVALAGFLALCFAAAYVGGRFTSASLADWYVTLQKPSWTPPGALIGAVWSVLYTLMAVAAWLVWLEGGFRGHPFAFGLFAVQLVLNVGWSVVFFGLRAPGPALVEIGLLAASVAATLVAFWRVKPSAGLLFVPYLAWVCFASFLNFTLWRLNR